MRSLLLAAVAASSLVSPALAASKVCASGSGAGTTRPFHMDGPFVVTWTLTGANGLFQASIMPKTGGDSMAALTGIIANQMDTTPGQSYQPAGGDFYISVNDVALHWTVCAEAQ
jgi:hypothetical protein